MTVVFDISRLISRARFETPTGIDRFELNYAIWAVERFQKRLQFVANGPFGPRSVSLDSAQSLIAATAEKWSSNHHGNDQGNMLQRLVERIEGRAYPSEVETGPGSGRAHDGPKRQQLLNALKALCWSPLRIPSSSLFIHVSHAQIHQQSNYDWLAQRACRPLFYVHDLIPLLRPEFCRAGEAARHATRIQTILRFHRLVLCNSQSTARTLDELAEATGLNQPCTAVLPPGLEHIFLQFDPASSVRSTRPYFVCLGTVEPRKNHGLLLDIWRQLVERYGARAPRLVIAGRRGWDNAHVFSLLNQPQALQGAVIEVAGLNDRSVARLLGGASALLAPSHIEGYGMPVAEALALGTPVIASNIRAHREASRGRALLLDTLDGLGWLAAIEAHAQWPRRSEHCVQKQWTWTAHFEALHRLLVSARLEPAAEQKRRFLRPSEFRNGRLSGDAESCPAT